MTTLEPTFTELTSAQQAVLLKAARTILGISPDSNFIVTITPSNNSEHILVCVTDTFEDDTDDIDLTDGGWQIRTTTWKAILSALLT